jgi:hypothetical protein
MYSKGIITLILKDLALCFHRTKGEKNMLKILQYFWQWPQTLLALIVIKITKAKKLEKKHRDRAIYLISPKCYISGASFGEFIIVKDANSKILLDHEYGHSVQSRILGPLYLLAVGLPSAVFNNLWDRQFHRKWNNMDRLSWYYSRYPEKWADKLGGVKRGYVK